MNHPWVQQVSAAPPWWRAALFAALSDGVQIGGAAAVCSMPGSFLQISVLLHLIYRGSSPTSRGKQGVCIYGIFGEILRRKIPETVDAVGVAPTASIVLG